MDSYSHLSKIDLQIEDYSIVYYEKMFTKFPKECLKCDDILKSYYSINWINYLEEVLKRIVPPNLYDKVKDELIYSDYPHGKCYYFEDYQKLGLNVRQPDEYELRFFI